MKDEGDDDKCMGMDEKNFQSETFQRPFQYLLRYQNGQDLDNFKYERPEGMISKEFLSSIYRRAMSPQILHPDSVSLCITINRLLSAQHIFLVACD